MRKRIVAAVVCLGLAGVAGYSWATREPTPIKVDPSIYDSYAGHYDFRNNYIVTIRREGDRLTSTVPEMLPQELFPETPTTFFVKGQPGRIVFYRGTNGQADYMAY